MMPIIRSARSLPDFAVEIEWQEGGVSVISFHETIAKGGVFAPLADPEFFGKVIVSPGQADWILAPTRCGTAPTLKHRSRSWKFSPILSTRTVKAQDASA